MQCINLEAKLTMKKVGRIWSHELSRNAAMSMLQALVSAASMFMAYRLMIREVGIEKLGLWSALLAGSTAARLLDVSGSSGLAKYVAERISHGDSKGLVQYVHTTLIATLAFNCIAALLILALSDVLIGHFVGPIWHAEVRTLLPIAMLGSIVLPAVTSAISSAIDGMQKAQLRAICNISSSVIFIACTVYWVPEKGIWGYGYALVAQQLYLLVVSWLALRRLIPSIGWLPSQVSRTALQESFGFGLRVQTNSLASLLSEPLAKFMLASLGGLALLGYYEVASRLVFQAKGLFVAGIQPLMPALASLNHMLDTQSALLVKAQRMCIMTGSALFIGLVLIGIPYSWIMLDRWDLHLQTMIVVLSCGATINLFSVPLYFASMAKGVMRWNIVSQLAVALCVVVSGTLGGQIFGGNAVIGGIVSGLITGGVICQFGNLYTLRLTQVMQPLQWPYWIALLANIAATLVLCIMLQSAM